MRRRWRQWALLGLTMTLFSACASSAPPVDEEVPSAEGYYLAALEKLEGQRSFIFFRDVDFPKAIELFQEVIDNYPYSEYATLAELRIADVHFERENYEEAASYYQDFVELHPTNEQVPYAIYRNGLCSFEQMREPFQDQTPTKEAIAHFQVLLERYPDSEMTRDTEARLHEAQDQLAQASVVIGDFYFGRGNYYAAVKRYREALTDFPSHRNRTRTLARLATSLKRMHRLYEAEQIFQQVLAMEPTDEDLVDDVRGELEEIESSGFGPSAVPMSRSCVTDPNPACGNGDAVP
jgi:outer membrane protein assembly factor BamD